MDNNSVKKIVDEYFDYVDLIPVPFSVIDLEKNCFVKGNNLFNDMIKSNKEILCSYDEVIKSTDINFNEVLEGKKDKNGYFVIVKTFDNSLLPLIAQSFIYEVYGKKFLLSSYVNIIKNIISDNVIIEDFNGNNLIVDIIKDMPLFACILSFNKRKILFSNKVCDRFFGTSIVNRNSEDYFYELEKMDNLFNSKVSHVEYNSIIGSKWFTISACHILYNNENCILLLAKDISKMKKLEDKLLQMAVTDDFTKTYNRKAGIDFIRDYLEELSSDSKIFTASYIKINNIELIQDKFGLAASDNCILTIVRKIKSAIRQTDIFARMDRDEFIILFPNCMLEIVQKIMNTIINKLEVLNTKQDDYKYSISFGIVESSKDNDYSVDDIIREVRNLTTYDMESYK